MQLPGLESLACGQTSPSSSDNAANVFHDARNWLYGQEKSLPDDVCHLALSQQEEYLKCQDNPEQEEDCADDDESKEEEEERQREEQQKQREEQQKRKEEHQKRREQQKQKQEQKRKEREQEMIAEWNRLIDDTEKKMADLRTQDQNVESQQPGSQGEVECRMIKKIKKNKNKQAAIKKQNEKIRREVHWCIEKDKKRKRSIERCLLKKRADAELRASGRPVRRTCNTDRTGFPSPRQTRDTRDQGIWGNKYTSVFDSKLLPEVAQSIRNTIKNSPTLSRNKHRVLGMQPSHCASGNDFRQIQEVEQRFSTFPEDSDEEEVEDLCLFLPRNCYRADNCTASGMSPTPCDMHRRGHPDCLINEETCNQRRTIRPISSLLIDNSRGRDQQRYRRNPCQSTNDCDTFSKEQKSRALPSSPFELTWSPR